ncbi:MAG: hypothetical protein EXQ63_04170 [Ilumatobacteraceae bacterium]|nr:hypothetical protein [Ilumatobacteraceae bacterium]
MSSDAQNSGALILRINIFMTTVFILASILSATLFRQPWKGIAVVVSLACFSVGVVVFLWGYWNAVQRSRADNIGVGAMYFLLDGVAPRAVGQIMNGCLAAQSVVALSAALARGSTNGRAGSTLAFGILAPMLGLGLNGLWAAFHGTFGPRIDAQGDAILAPKEQGSSAEGSRTGHDKDHD